MEQVEATTAKGGGKIPPYVSWKTFGTFIDDLHRHTVPGRIDRTVLNKFSGTVRSQLLTALRFLSLIDENDVPTDHLRGLVRARGTTEWPSTLAQLLQAAYRPVFAVNVQHATAGQFREAFSTFPGKEDVLAKSRAFFLQAAKEAEIALSPRILQQSRERPSAPRRKTAPKDTRQNGHAEQIDVGNGNGQGTVGQVPPPAAPKSVYDVLLSIWKPGQMPDDVDAAVVTLLRYLKQQEVEATKIP